MTSNHSSLTGSLFVTDTNCPNRTDQTNRQKLTNGTRVSGHEFFCFLLGWWRKNTRKTTGFHPSNNHNSFLAEQTKGSLVIRFACVSFAWTLPLLALTRIASTKTLRASFAPLPSKLQLVTSMRVHLPSTETTRARSLKPMIQMAPSGTGSLALPLDPPGSSVSIQQRTGEQRAIPVTRKDEPDLYEIPGALSPTYRYLSMKARIAVWCLSALLSAWLSFGRNGLLAGLTWTAGDGPTMDGYWIGRFLLMVCCILLVVWVATPGPLVCLIVFRLIECFSLHVFNIHPQTHTTQRNAGVRIRRR